MRIFTLKFKLFGAFGSSRSDETWTSENEVATKGGLEFGYVNMKHLVRLSLAAEAVNPGKKSSSYEVVNTKLLHREGAGLDKLMTLVGHGSSGGRFRPADSADRLRT